MSARSRCSRSCSRASWVYLCILPVVAPYPVAAASSSFPDLTVFLPEDVQSLVYLRSVPATLEAIRNSPIGRFYDDPANREFLSPLDDLLGGQGMALKEMMAGNDGSETRWLTGALVAARLPPPAPDPKEKKQKKKKKSKPRYLIVFEHGGESGNLKPWIPAPGRRGVLARKIRLKEGDRTFYRLEWVREIYDDIKLKGERKYKKASSYRLTRLQALDPVRVRRQIVTAEHLYIGPGLGMRCGADPAPMREALRRIAAGNPSGRPAGGAKRRMALLPFRALPAIEIYFDLEQWSAGKDWPGKGSLLGRGADAKRLGVGDVKSAALGIDFEDDRLALELSLYSPRPRRGFGRLLFINQPLNLFPNLTSRPAAPDPAHAFIPRDALAYTGFSSNLSDFWRELRLVVRDGAPMLDRLLKTYFRALQATTDVDFEADFIAHLGTRWMTFSRYPSRSRTKSKPEMTYMIEVEHANLLRPALNRWIGMIASLLNYRIQEIPVGRWTCYRLVGAEDTAGAVVPLDTFANICLTDRYLYFSRRPEHIAASIDRATGLGRQAAEADGVAQNDWRAVMDELNSDRFFEAYGSPRAYASVLGAPLVKLSRELMAAAAPSLVDVDESPGADVWSRYFGPMGAEAVAGRENIVVRFFMLYADRNAP